MDVFDNTYALLAFIATYAFFVWVARKIAVDKGLDPRPYFALAIFLTPLVGIIGRSSRSRRRSRLSSDVSLQAQTGSAPFVRSS